MTQTDTIDFGDVRWGSVEWTNLGTLYLRAYESRPPAPILGDVAAAEAVDRRSAVGCCSRKIGLAGRRR
jgi:O-methyltransferase involved in polyketide biosynthesis